MKKNLYKFSVYHIIGVFVLVAAISLLIFKQLENSSFDYDSGQTQTQQTNTTSNEGGYNESLPFYSITEINRKNLPPGNYNTEGVVDNIYTCPLCPKDAVCEPCIGEHIFISNGIWKEGLIPDETSIYENQLILFMGSLIGLERGKLYKFSIRIPTPYSFSGKSVDAYNNRFQLLGYQSKDTTALRSYKNEKYVFELQYPLEWQALEQDYAGCDYKDCLYHGQELPLSHQYPKLFPRHTICFGLANRNDRNNDSPCEMELYVLKEKYLENNDPAYFFDCLKVSGAKMAMPLIGGIQSQGVLCKNQGKVIISNYYIKKDGLVYLFSFRQSEQDYNQQSGVLNTFHFLNVE